MPAKENNTHVQISKNDGYILITIVGNLLTNEEVSHVLEQLNSQIDEHHILIDLSNTDYVSSSGLTLFIRLLTRTRINNKRLILCNPQEKLVKLFRITKLYDIFALSNSLEEAIKTLK